MQAFVDRSTWTQADLARAVGVDVRVVRTVLGELSDAGMPLEREADHPHVYWSVRRGWFPGGVYFDAADWEVLVDAVLRVADDARRRKLLERLVSGRRVVGSVQDDVERLERAVVGLPVTQQEREAMGLVQQALLERKALTIHYYSASRRAIGDRTISPQRLVTEPHARLAAHCHEKNALRWFRLDSIQRARVDAEARFVDVAEETVDAFVAASPDGFHDGTDEELVFWVSPEAAAWVRGNLLLGMRVLDDSERGMRVSTRGGAPVVARFVASLGGDARAEGERLRELVLAVARGSLERNQEKAAE